MNDSFRRIFDVPRRAVITGWSLGWPDDADCWRELNAACRPDTLRRSIERGQLQGECGAASINRWPREAFSEDSNRFTKALCRAAREVNRVGLWNDGLTVDASRVAVCFSSSKGEMTQLESAFDAFSPRMSTHAPADASSVDGEASFAGECGFWNWAPDAPARFLSRLLGARGACLSPVAACASGAHAIALGAQWIEDGYADVVVAGAIEAGLSPLVMAAYTSLGALSTSGVMRPFDQNRDGFVPREGVALLILESTEHARRRGARIEGAVTGWSLNADATAMTSMSPGGESIDRAIRQSLARAGNPRIDYVNAHGTATRANDALEARAIARAFGSQGASVSSTKPLTGHWLGAAGALEAVLCLLAMRERFAPPTLYLENPDADCPLDFGPPQGRDCEIQHALSLSYGFGGHIGALVLENADNNDQAHPPPKARAKPRNEA